MNKNKSKSILLVANYDSDVGYAWWLMESYWVAISEQYRDSHNSHLVFPSISVMPKNIEDSNIYTYTLDFSKKGLQDVLAQCKFIKQHNIELIYFSDRGLTRWIYALYRLYGAKTIIVHDHTPGERSEPVGIKKLLKTIKLRLPFINVDGAIGATEYIQWRLNASGLLPEHKCFAAPNGIVVNSIENSDRNLRRYGIDETAKIIVTTARANKYKGVDFALDVMAELITKRGVKNIHYLMLGDGPDLDPFKSKALRLEIDKYVSMPGRVSGIDRILPHCYLAFHPSLREVGYCLAILEYMAAKLPVVVSDNPTVCGATIDNINGAIYQAHDVISAADKIETYLTSPKMQEAHGLAAFDEVNSKYTLANTHSALLDAVNSIMTSK